MKNVKRIFPAFSFYDRSGIQEYLEKKAEEGWMLEKLGGLSWTFRRMEPKKLHFALTYFPKASAFDPTPGEQELVFREFCAHSGWNLVAASAQMQIFCNEMENPVPIETDPGVELENIHATAKKVYLPSYFMLLPVGIIPWLSISFAWRNDPLGFLSSNIYFYNILTSIICLTLCAMELTGYYRWRAKAMKAAEEGEFVKTKGNRTLQIILVCVMLIALLFLMLGASDNHISAMLITMVLLISLATAVSVGATKLMKRMKFSARKNRIITLIIILFTSFAAIGLGTFGVIQIMDTWEKADTTLPTYEYLGRTRILHQDDLPLKIQDMIEADLEIYSYEWIYEAESLLLHTRTAYQRPRLDMLEQPDLTYTIVDVKADFLYDFCLWQMLEEIDYRGYNWINPEPWGAREVYGAFVQTGYYDMYIICYDDRIVALEADWLLTEDQMAVIGVKLG